MMTTVQILEGSAPERADKALRRLLPDVPAWVLRDAFSRRDVKRGEQRISPDAIVSGGDTLYVYLPARAESMPLQIVFEDDAYLVVCKRQGMSVQGEGSVEVLAARHMGKPAHACHRLDVMTGGLLLLAKTEQALSVAEDAFANHALTKTYRALVRGCPAPREATLTAYLRKDADRATVRIFDRPAPGSLPIETRYRVLAAGEVSRVEIDLVTGRTHQIRAHLAHIGHPVLGDDKYGDRAFNRTHGARRQRLWATRLVLWDGRAFETQEPF
jgi:Pseudouridylate synthases, 23S RNA-specific